jgi:hypothetical protein
MPALLRWWLNRQWARDARGDLLARIDLTLVVFGVTLALLWR